MLSLLNKKNRRDDDLLNLGEKGMRREALHPEIWDLKRKATRKEDWAPIPLSGSKNKP